VVAGLEFGVDLQARSGLLKIVVAIDVALMVGYAASLGRSYLLRPADTLAWLRRRRVDLLILAGAALFSLFSPRVGASLVIIRVSLGALNAGLSSEPGRRVLARLSPTPSQTVALSFIAMIGVATVFLLAPAATVDGQGASLTDAVFTATSATTVTGLVVVDTGTYFTTFGQVVLLFIMQIGAIGIMVLAAAFAILVGGRLAAGQQEGLEYAGMGSLFDVYTAEGLRKLVVAIAGATFVIEAIAGALFFCMWGVGFLELPAQFDSVAGAAWWSVFYAISAFCHAGFVLTSDSLTPWASDPIVSNLFALIITISQLGFAVIADLWFQRSWAYLGKPTRLWSKLHVQTRIVLTMTLALNVLGTLFILFFEYDGALDGLSLPAKVNAAFFQAVTLRSAGFNTFDFGIISAPTVILCLLWMFIGAAPGSVGGGVRTTTTAVVVLAVRALARGREEVEVFGRTIPKIIVYRSLTVFIVAGAACSALIVALVATQPLPLDALLFEALSAFGTVGVSMGITSDLDATGKWIITLLMYIGRIGPLTMALAVSTRTRPQAYRYPDCEIAVG
jgi:trk system potassium uptake protein TrkH